MEYVVFDCTVKQVSDTDTREAHSLPKETKKIEGGWIRKYQLSKFSTRELCLVLELCLG